MIQQTINGETYCFPNTMWNNMIKCLMFIVPVAQGTQIQFDNGYVVIVKEPFSVISKNIVDGNAVWIEAIIRDTDIDLKWIIDRAKIQDELDREFDDILKEAKQRGVRSRFWLLRILGL